MPPPTKFETHVVCAILEMSHKYDVAYLVERAMLHLERQFPTQLRLFEDSVWPDSLTSATPSSSLETLLGFFDVASIFSATWIFPALCYSICVYPMADIVRSDKWQQLIAEDQNRLITGYPAQVLATREILESLGSSSKDSKCVTPDTCAEGSTSWAKKAHAQWKFPLYRSAADPLSLERWLGSNLLGFGTNLCDSCISAAKLQHRQARQSVWERLPAMFQLPNWNELETQRLTYHKS